MADSQALGRTISHGFVQRPLEVPDELTFPQLTERGPHTDAYLEETPSGLVLAREAEAGQVYPTPSRRASRQSTLVSPHAAAAGGGGGGEKVPPTATKPEVEAVDDTKLVTWLVDDPQNPRNWSHTKKWYVPRPLDAVPFRLSLPPVDSFPLVPSPQGSDHHPHHLLLHCRFREFAHHGRHARAGRILWHRRTRHEPRHRASVPSFRLACPFNGADLVYSGTQCVFVVGFGVGPLFLAPLSEMYGRRIVYIVSMFLYFILILPECVTDSFAVMIIFRCVFSSLGVCPAPLTPFFPLLQILLRLDGFRRHDQRCVSPILQISIRTLGTDPTTIQQRLYRRLVVHQRAWLQDGRFLRYPLRLAMLGPAHRWIPDHDPWMASNVVALVRLLGRRVGDLLAAPRRNVRSRFVFFATIEGQPH